MHTPPGTRVRRRCDDDGSPVLVSGDSGGDDDDEGGSALKEEMSRHNCRWRCTGEQGRIPGHAPDDHQHSNERTFPTWWHTGMTDSVSTRKQLLAEWTPIMIWYEIMVISNSTLPNLYYSKSSDQTCFPSEFSWNS